MKTRHIEVVKRGYVQVSIKVLRRLIAAAEKHHERLRKEDSRGRDYQQECRAIAVTEEIILIGERNRGDAV